MFIVEYLCKAFFKSISRDCLINEICTCFEPAEKDRHPGLDPGSPEISQSQGIAGQARNDAAQNSAIRLGILHSNYYLSNTP